MIGTRVSGPVSAELRDTPGGAGGPAGRWSKILSLAPKVSLSSLPLCIHPLIARSYSHTSISIVMITTDVLHIFAIHLLQLDHNSPARSASVPCISKDDMPTEGHRSRVSRAMEGETVQMDPSHCPIQHDMMLLHCPLVRLPTSTLSHWTRKNHACTVRPAMMT